MKVKDILKEYRCDGAFYSKREGKLKPCTRLLFKFHDVYGIIETRCVNCGKIHRITDFRSLT